MGRARGLTTSATAHVAGAFAPRQRQKPMNELLTAVQDRPEPDVIGSLIDADMGAYYNWLNQQRLAGEAQSSFPGLV